MIDSVANWRSDTRMAMTGSSCVDAVERLEYVVVVDQDDVCVCVLYNHCVLSL
jgi:hypothetical protein